MLNLGKEIMFMLYNFVSMHHGTVMTERSSSEVTLPGESRAG